MLARGILVSIMMSEHHKKRRKFSLNLISIVSWNPAGTFWLKCPISGLLSRDGGVRARQRNTLSALGSLAWELWFLLGWVSFNNICFHWGGRGCSIPASLICPWDTVGGGSASNKPIVTFPSATHYCACPNTTAILLLNLISFFFVTLLSVRGGLVIVQISNFHRNYPISIEKWKIHGLKR